MAMSVGKLAQDDVVTADKDASLPELADAMESEGVGAIVVTSDDEPVGIVTDREIALSVSDDGVDSETAEDVMTEDIEYIRQDAESVELAGRLGEAKVRRLPVVDDSGDLVGIVTLDDLVSILGEQLAEVADVIEVQSPAYSPGDELA